jgi:hypothetical protein
MIFRKKRKSFLPSDTFLISYPRSGNTWLRFMLTQLHPDESLQPTVRDIHRVIPNLDQDPDLSVVPRPRVLKSHCYFDRRMRRVIYLVRDGRDSMASYYRFSRKEFGYSGTFLEFLEQPQFSLFWHEHVSGWLDNAGKISLLPVRYERLQEDCVGELQRVLDFLGWEVRADKVRQTVEESSIGKLKAREKQGEFLAHVGEGRIGGWSSEFGPQETKFFLGQAEGALNRMGYLS